jgi:hypothetical protein
MTKTDDLQNIVAGYTDGIPADTESNRSYKQTDEGRMNSNTIRGDGLKLTKKERKAIAFAAEHFGAFKNQAATLLGILERLK